MYPSEQPCWSPAAEGSSLSAAAAPYVPGSCGAAAEHYVTGAWQAEGGHLPGDAELLPQAPARPRPAAAGAPVLELAMALAPEEGKPVEPLSWPRPAWATRGGAGGAARAAGRDEGNRHIAKVETPKTKRRQMCLGTGQPDETPTKAARAAAQLRQLLDFYFEPFNMQHNRYLLDLLARRVGPPERPGPWPAESLLDFTFGFDDLAGLGRIASALTRLKLGSSEQLGPLRHLCWTGDGRLQLRSPPEVRSFVAAPHADAEAVAAAARYLAAVREQRGAAPPGLLSVLAYSLQGGLAGGDAQGQQYQSQLKRQLLLHHCDIVCLQGVDPEGTGAGIAAALREEGYGFAFARSADGSEANAIFWDKTRLELEGRRERGPALAIDLRPEEGGVVIRAISARPAVPTTFDVGLKELFEGGRSAGSPLIVSADLTVVGGAESAAVVEELAGLPSLAQRVLGEELLVPVQAARAEGGGPPAPVRAAASGLNRLHRPDAVLFEGMVPVLALSGHTELYMLTMAPEDVVQQFPAFRIPIVAAFDWRTKQTQMSECTAAPA
mmetsp:Transcript_974/g.2814  ORF Transcript_974/g.2814 Transcript_974/m.2814 type:complete len:552 (-) Transcript_974:172-1827(-)